MIGKGLLGASVLVCVVALGTTATAAPPPIFEQVRRGMVAIERNGAPVALGTVLDGDGRILTALSGLGGDRQVDVRYGDGTRARAALVRQDAKRDLALLSPEGASRTEGLRASEVDPTGRRTVGLLPTISAQLTTARASGLRDVRSPTGESLKLLDVDVGPAPIAGAPLLDSNGRVLAVLVRACDPAPGDPGVIPPGAWEAPATPACRPVIAGAPVSEIRSFLAPAALPTPAPTAPASPASPPPVTPAAPASRTTPAWLGIQGEPLSFDGLQGVRVVAVAPASPAARAGLSASRDVIVAVDGRNVRTPDELAAEIARRSPGVRLRLLVCGAGDFRDVEVALQAAPDR